MKNPMKTISTTVFLSLLVFNMTMWAAQAPSAGVWTHDPQAPDAACPSMPACSSWQVFRSAHPWPYQAFAVQPMAGEAIVIVSEPPPALSREKLERTLRALFGADLLDLQYDRWPTGLDGWLEDVVLRVRLTNPATIRVLDGSGFESWRAPAEIVDRLQLLNGLLHRTTDGFWIDRVVRTQPTSSIDELKVPVSDLAGWLSDGQRIWLPISELGGRRTTQELWTEKSSGVFQTGSGVIALVAPKGLKLTDLAADFRRFAVESDLIIGGAGMTDGGLLLLGRARQIPLATLPPLRFESLVAFARNHAEHLAQSYERQRIFAGPIRTGKYASWDWAPILLSTQLDDSEFGTLLNMADQILKSWSQHGQVEYYSFFYPKPDRYPFGNESASDYFAGKFRTSTLLFNWNTESLATISTVNGREILTADRTGALNVLYRPSDSIETQSPITARRMRDDADARAKDAREYFATRGDPLLVRVVQNVLLYQAAQSFLVVADAQEPAKASRSDQATTVLQKRAAAWLAEIMQGKTDIDRRVTVALNKFMGSSGFTVEKMAAVLASPQTVERELQRAFESYNTAVAEAKWMPAYLADKAQTARELFESTCASVGGQIVRTAKGRECKWQERFGLTGLSPFASYNAFADGLEKLGNQYEATKARLDHERQQLVSSEKTYEQAVEIASILTDYSGGVDLDDLLKSILQTTSAVPVNGSIRTPTVVLSKNSVDIGAIGGHNIDLIPRRRLITPDIPVLLGTPKPSIRATRVAELAPPRHESEALGIRRTGSLLDEMRASAKQAEMNHAPWQEMQVQAKACQCDAVVKQAEDGTIYLVRNTPSPSQQVIFGKSGIIDALAGPPPAKLVRFENFSDSTVENVARSTGLIATGVSESDFGDALDTISSLFKTPLSSSRNVSVAIQRPGKPAEVLRFGEAPGSLALLNDRVPWRGSVVEPTSRAQWAEEFGPASTIGFENSRAMTVRPGNSPMTDQVLYVRVRVEAGLREGIATRLQRIIEQWVGSQPAAAKPWADSMIELREAISRQLKLKPGDLEFYYKHNKAKLRAAETTDPAAPRCSHMPCAA